MKCIECPYLVKDLQHHKDNASGMYDKDFHYATIKYYCGHPASFQTTKTYHYSAEKLITHAVEIPLNSMINNEWCPLNTEIHYHD